MPTATEILRAHRITRHARLSAYATTCPECSDKRWKKKQKCLSVLIDGEGVRFNCHHCGWHGHEFYDEPNKPDAVSKLVIIIIIINEKGDDDRVRIKRARQIWNEAVGPRGTVVEGYLANRGLRLLDSIADRVVRFHGSCPWKGDDEKLIRVPAMISAMVDIHTNKLRAIQKTWLDQYGSKVDRKMQGVASGTAIKLSADDEVTMAVGVSEGFETAIAVMMQDWRPVWALGSDKGVANLPILPGIECLTIFGDNDREDKRGRRAGQQAAAACARRWREVGVEVQVRIPKGDGRDWNDVVRAAA
jgi:Toprim domain